MNMVKQVCKRKRVKIKDLASQLGIQYQSLNKSLKNPSLLRLEKISEILNVDIHELIICSEKFNHIYDQDGEWYGIGLKKQ